MLQIYLHGTREQGFLDISPGTVLNMESLSNAFDEDLNVGEFSLPVDIPWTNWNRRLFGFAERIENNYIKNSYWICDVYDNLFPELVAAKLIILEKIGSFTYKNGSFSASISATKGIFGSLIKNKKLRSLSLGGIIPLVGKTSREFAEDLMKGNQPSYPYVAFAPVAIENFFDTQRSDYGGEFLAKDTVNTVIITGTGLNDWTFGRPTSADPTIAAASGNAEYMDYRTVPFFNLKYVLKKVFEEYGFAVSGAIFDNTDFDDVFIFNNYGIENYAPSIFEDFNTFIKPFNHVPDILIPDFLKGVLSFLGMYPVFTSGSEVKLFFRKNNFVNKKILSINEICSDQFDSTYSDPDSQNGYKLNYVWDNQDAYYSERVKDLTDKTLVAEVATFGDLAALDIGRALTTDDIAYVKADNIYYSVADATSTPIKWDAYAEQLDSFIKDAGERGIDLPMSTLCTYVEFNTVTGLFEKRNYCGCRQPGSYINNKGTLVVNDFGLRIFYIKKISIGGINIPVSFNYNRDSANNKTEKYSLVLKGEDGVATNFHQQWENMKQQMEIVKTSIIANKKVLNDLDSNNVIEHNSVLYFPYQINRTIPLKDPSQDVNMMEIQLVPL